MTGSTNASDACEPADAAKRRTRVDVMNMVHRTRGLNEGYVPHTLNAAPLLKDAWNEVNGITIAR